MTPSASSHDTLGRRLLILAVAISAAQLILGHVANYVLTPDDDRLFLYVTGVALGRPAELRRGVELVSASLAAHHQDGPLLGVQLRERYRHNYLLPSLVYRAAAELSGSAHGQGDSAGYPDRLADALVSGFAAMFALSCLCLLGVVLWTRDPRLIVALAVALTVIASLEAVFDAFGDRWVGRAYLLPQAGTDQRLAKTLLPRTAGLLLNPRHSFSPFGDTPRNHFILLTLTVFALRWKGWRAASYAVLLGLAVVHQSFAGMLLALLATADLLLRPEVFLDRRVSAAVAAGALLYLARETLRPLARFAIGPPMLAAACVCAAIGLIGWRFSRSRRAGWAPVLQSWRLRALGHGDVGADLLILGALWVVTLPIAYVLNRFGGAEGSIVLAQLHGRMLALGRPALFLAFGIRVFERYGRKGRATSILLAACAVTVLVNGASKIWIGGRNPVARVREEVRALDTELGPSIDWTSVGSKDIPVTYYALVRLLDRGK